ncbi:MAG: sugar ABC transporter ATP-binding protein [Verrucomicrobia bacterium]|nr:sugar ABC transporter ATP-binding protein [Verrucomicrobiota bacterium]
MTLSSSQPASLLSQPLLQMREIHERFPGVHVLKGVNFDVYEGEVHALIGENGAGKSTLMHILAGVCGLESGRIDFGGRSDIIIPDGHSSQQLGIAIVFQERSLFGTLSVAENIFAARQPANRLGKIDRKKLSAQTRALLTRVGLDVEPRTPLSELPPAQQHMAEIAKALSLNARLIIFDEPTAALTETETRALFKVIGQLKQAGVGIVYISHRLEEIFQIANRVTVLKDGAWQGTFQVSETNTDDLIARMVGRELSLHRRREDVATVRGRVILDVRNLTDAEQFRGSRPFLQNISLQARAGEIAVFAGLAGAGRTELALSLFGVRPRASGDVYIDGRQVFIRSPADAIAAGFGYTSEDRKEAGLFLDQTITQNIVSSRLNEFGAWWLDDRRGEQMAEQFRRKLSVNCQGVRQVVQTLSGGNQQKIVLAKWLLVNPRVLVVDEPTRGIDVGAKAEVHTLLREFASGGAAVIVISSDLPEVLAIADRILVMREGRIVGEVAGSEATEEKIMRLAAISV